MGLFLPATCASEKIPLGSQTCEQSECAAASRNLSQTKACGFRLKENTEGQYSLVPP